MAGGMTGGRPVLITIVSYDRGMARIMADGKHQVGLVLGEFYGVRAYLWPVAGKRPGDPHEVERAWFPLLRDARAGLRKRVAKDGPWWTG